MFKNPDITVARAPVHGLADFAELTAWRVGMTVRPTITNLSKRYLAGYVAVRCKPRTVASFRWLVVKLVLPELGALAIKVVEREYIPVYHRPRECPVGQTGSSKSYERWLTWPELGDYGKNA